MFYLTSLLFYQCSDTNFFRIQAMIFSKPSKRMKLTRSNIMILLLMVPTAYSAKPKFRANAAYEVEWFHKDGQLVVTWEPFKMVEDTKHVDKTELKRNGLKIKTGPMPYTPVTSLPIVSHGRYQYTISTTGPCQQVRGRRNQTQICR